MLKAAVSGSFHRHMPAIYEAVGDLRGRGVTVLSPSDPRIVDNLGEFLFVASDKLRSVRLVQDRHLEAIQAADFLWLVCPDGYTGPSTCMEIGAAHAAGVPVYSVFPALDVTVGEYVKHVSSASEAVARIRARNRNNQPTTLLLDPDLVIDEAISALSDLRPSLLGKAGNGSTDAERKLFGTRVQLARSLGLDRSDV